MAPVCLCKSSGLSSIDNLVIGDFKEALLSGLMLHLGHLALTFGLDGAAQSLEAPDSMYGMFDIQPSIMMQT